MTVVRVFYAKSIIAIIYYVLDVNRGRKYFRSQPDVGLEITNNVTEKPSFYPIGHRTVLP